MKLVSFVAEGQHSYGVVNPSGVVDLGRRLAELGFPTLRTFLAGFAIVDAARFMSMDADHELESLTFEPVIPDPDKIICVGLNYRDHAAEVGRTVVENPSLFARFAGSQVGNRQPLIKPRVSEEFDFEGELAVVIGKAGRHVSRLDALQHVAGYACYNDGSVRDWQRHTSQFLAGKTFAGTGAFGPWLVTTDESGDPKNMILETRVNNLPVQHSPIGEMIFGVPELIEYCSTILPLLPGDVIVTGTPGGVGARRDPPQYLAVGDVVEVEIGGVGLLRNHVEAEEELYPVGSLLP